jgi:hypothetical protein
MGWWSFRYGGRGGFRLPNAAYIAAFGNFAYEVG